MPILLEDVEQQDQDLEGFENPGWKYHRESCISRVKSYEDFQTVSTFNQMHNLAGYRTTYKVYEDAPAIPLSSEYRGHSKPMDQIVRERSSVRNFSNEKLGLDQLSSFLKVSYSQLDRPLWDGGTVNGRTIPSPGGRYSLEVYPIVFGVEGLESGVYHYNPVDFRLEFIKPAVTFQQTQRAIPDLENRPSVYFCITSVYRRMINKYGKRGFRLIYMESGVLQMSFSMAATDHGLVGYNIAGGVDLEVLDLIGVDPHFEVYSSGFALGMPVNKKL